MFCMFLTIAAKTANMARVLVVDVRRAIREKNQCLKGQSAESSDPNWKNSMQKF